MAVFFLGVLMVNKAPREEETSPLAGHMCGQIIKRLIDDRKEREEE
jgi:hypothetical protein